ncbi:MAG TPA: glycosyltransferase family 39 protein, partial [Blastocatellia bacterium]
MRSKKTVSAVFIPLAIGFFLAAAAVCALPALLPIKLAQSWLDSLVTIGHTGQTIGAIKLRLLVAAWVSVLFALAIFLGRASLSSVIDLLPSAFRDLAGRAAGTVTHGLKKETSFHLALIGLVGILAIGLRLFYLFQPMCGDESWTFDKYASMPIYIGLARYTSPNNHLFHTLLVHISFLIFGNHPWAIRLPAFIAGILAVPVAYLIVRGAAGKYAAILAAGLVASSPALIMYSTNARGHILIVLIFELNVLVGLVMLDDRNAAVWITFGFLNAIGLITVPVMLYPFGATVLMLIWLAGT